MFNKVTLLTIMFTALLPGLVLAQQEEISGKVTDGTTGQPLPGVNITVEGTLIGTATDNEGNYTLSVPSLDETLVFSFIGYQTREIPIDGRTVINVDLQPIAITGEDILVIGYGTQRREDLTGSISSVNAEEFEARNISSFEEGLQGLAPGIRVVQGSGQPGGRTRIRIRGQNSILGGSEPLYVVDGVPVQSDSDGNTSMLATINPGDIESIEVLKDASATAIYGARGSNGVVLITTKKGESGVPTVNFQNSVSIGKVIKELDMLNSREFVELANERFQNDGETIPFPDVEAASAINTDWQDEIFRTAITQNYSLSFSGGDESTQYFISGNYSDQEGTIIGSGFSRGSFRLNLEQQISERLDLSSQLFVSNSEGKRSNTETFGSGALLINALGMPPIAKPRDEEGNLTPGDELLGFPFSPSGGDNPLAIALERIDELKTNRFLGNVRARYTLYDNLSVEVMIGTDHITNENDQFSSRVLRNITDGSGSERRTESTNYIIENVINYSTDFGQGNHRINATGGFTWEMQETDFISASASGFVTDDLKNNNLGAGERFDSPNTGISEWDLLSFLGRINYTFKDRYLFTITGRRDGSSRFGEGNRWGFFPSVAVAWRLSNEEFLSQIDQISELKMRFSWGKSGNQAISPFQSLQRFSPQELALGGSSRIGFSPENIGNPNLKWETTEQFNVGLDLGLINQRLRMSLDLFHKETTDLLALVNLPPSSGFATTLQNIGSMENKGIELDIAADILRDRKLSWNIDFNISTNRNKVTHLARGADIIAPDISFVGSAHILREGEPISSFFGLEEDGLTEDGLINFVDQNGDGVIDSNDRVILGDAFPDFIYGFNTQLSYKNFDLSVFIQGEHNKELFNSNLFWVADSFSRGLNNIKAVQNRWTPDNPDPNSPFPKATKNLNIVWSDRFVEDASYLRLKNLRLSYNIPVEKLFTPLKSAKISVSGQNLVTITDYSWFNPDVDAFPSGDLRIGVDNQTFPVSKSVTFSLNISL